MEGNGGWLGHLKEYVPFVLAAGQDLVPGSLLWQLLGGIGLAAIGGAIGTATTLAVLSNKIDSITKVIEVLQTADEAQKQRLRALESRQAVDEALRDRK